jgi:adenylate kinase family enzyme
MIGSMAPSVVDPAFVLLITGPGGSGKSTLAAYIAEKLRWTRLSEDEYWISNGWGSGLRTEEQEEQVQQQVLRDAFAEIAAGRGVVLEFILYKLPPNPLTHYQKALSRQQIRFETIVLKPSVVEILARMTKRGRPSDLNRLELRSRDAEHQMAILEAPFIEPGWVVNPTHMTVDELYDVCLRRLSQAGAAV